MGNIISSELFEDGSGSSGKDELHTQSKPKRKRSKTLRRKPVVEYYHPSQDENDHYNADEESEDTHISRSSNSRIEEPEQTANYTPTTNRKKRKPSTYKNRATTD